MNVWVRTEVLSAQSKTSIALFSPIFLFQLLEFVFRLLIRNQRGVLLQCLLVWSNFHCLRYEEEEIRTSHLLPWLQPSTWHSARAQKNPTVFLCFDRNDKNTSSLLYIALIWEVEKCTETFDQERCRCVFFVPSFPYSSSAVPLLWFSLRFPRASHFLPVRRACLSSWGLSSFRLRGIFARFLQFSFASPFQYSSFPPCSSVRGILLCFCILL